MIGMRRSTILGAVIAAVAVASFSVPASAKRYHRRHVVLVGAYLKPGYVGAPGFVGGPPGPAIPMLVDTPAAPLGIFVGVPVLSGLGL